MKYENLFVFASDLSATIGALYRDNRFDRSCVVEFLDANGWFGAVYTIKDGAPQIKTAQMAKLRDPLELWLSAYRRTDRERTDILLARFASVYPKTCVLYRRFTEVEDLRDKPSAWKLLDFLFSEISKELTEYSEDELEELIKLMDVELPRTATTLFAKFINTAKDSRIAISEWDYTFKKRERHAQVNEAYPFDDFALMAYCVFNEQMWARQGLIEKALRGKTYAELWLFVAFHFVCGVRIGDLARLPAPALPYDADVTRTKISDGSFSKVEAAALTDEFQIRLSLKPFTPSKTSARGNVPQLRIDIPESLRAPLGVIMAISLSHHPEIKPGDGGFIKRQDWLNNARDFFGAEFAAALGNRRFHPRRCNKSYLQGIEALGDDEPGKPKGYMLAALARSHKSGIARLSETTDIYLRDANFGGYKPEFIVRQMFERGVFSFIPAALLEVYAGAEYTRLPVSSQTRLIGELGLTAFQIENALEVTERALIKSRNAVAHVLAEPLNIKANVGGILQNIASGNAPSLHADCLCLMTAAGLRCPNIDRDTCIGCGYEIYTKSAMYTLARDYNRLLAAKSSAKDFDAGRYRKMLEQAVLPAVAEMLTAAKILYPDGDTGELLNILEVEINGSNRLERRN